jgi:hypothetical protein
VTGDPPEAEKTRRGATRRGAAHCPAAAAFKGKSHGARRRRFPSQELEQVLWPGPALRLAGPPPGPAQAPGQGWQWLHGPAPAVLIMTPWLRLHSMMIAVTLLVLAVARAPGPLIMVD